MNKPERHTPFYISQAGADLPAIALNSEEFRRKLLALSEEELPGFLRAQVRFRVPAAFVEQTMLWETVRKWLSERLGVDAHEIGLVGSAQVGFSSRPIDFGRPFSATKSDLDFFIVNGHLYESLVVEVRRFCAQMGTPQGANFTDQIDTLNRTIKRDFFDLKQIPSREDYRKCSTLNNVASMVVDKLRLHSFELRHSYFRVYQSWPAFSKQVLLSYLDIKTKLK
jgi:hypothetical protein